MAKFYFKNPKKDEPNLQPSRNTLDFLLKYSKSLRVVEYHNYKFETILN